MTVSSSPGSNTVLLPMGLENIIFEFSFSEANPLSPPYSPVSPPPSLSNTPLEDGLKLDSSGDGNANAASFPYVQCLIYRSDDPKNYFLWSGTLTASPTIPFLLEYPDEKNISGNFCLYQNLSFGQYFVFFNTFYGEDLEHHYEGNMIQIPTS